MIYFNTYPYCVLRSPEDEGGGGSEYDTTDPATGGEDAEEVGTADDQTTQMAGQRVSRLSPIQIPPMPPDSDLPLGAIGWVWITSNSLIKKGKWVAKFPPKVSMKSKEGGGTTVEVSPLENKLYNTVSCPCSSYAIINSGGDVSCERDYFGDKQYITPTLIKNHFIDEYTPKIGDKWVCAKVKC